MPKEIIRLFAKREPDFKKINSSNKNKSFAIEPDDFSSLTDFNPDGFRRCYGPYKKKNKKTNAYQIYFLGGHPIHEYFSMEILNRLGINTPTTRLTKIQDQYSLDQTGNAPWLDTIASKGIEGYMSMKKLMAGETYQIDTKKQIIIDVKNKSEYKISGNAFGSDIAATLLEDGDYQPSGNNFGLIRVGNRFYTMAIDKEKSSFSGKDYKTLYNCISFKDIIFNDKLFESKTQEQSFFIVHQLSKALENNADGQSDVDHMFCNSRVMATPTLADECKSMCENFKSTAKSLITYFSENKNYDFKSYEEREKIREAIAEKIIGYLPLPDHFDTQTLKEIISEDLRAPYYQSFFADKKKKEISPADLKNNALLSAMIIDLKRELHLPIFLKKECQQVMIHYRHYKNRFFGLRWLNTSRESIEAAEKIMNAKSDTERYDIATSYVKQHPEKAFAKELSKFGIAK